MLDLGLHRGIFGGRRDLRDPVAEVSLETWVQVVHIRYESAEPIVVGLEGIGHTRNAATAMPAPIANVEAIVKCVMGC
jgi:hypothetical protein